MMVLTQLCYISKVTCMRVYGTISAESMCGFKIEIKEVFPTRKSNYLY